MKYSTILVLTLSTAFLAACGGGGGGTAGSTGPVVSTLSFPLRSAINASTAAASNYTLTANGTVATQATDGMCSGTFTTISSPANTAASFESAPALSSSAVATIAFTNCTPANTTVTTISYYDSNYLPLGSSSSSGSYSVYSQPLNIPVSVTVGNNGVIGTEIYYTDNTKATLDGRIDLTYAVEPDTSSTAIVNKISKRYNQASQLLFTVQERSRIDSTGNLTAIAIDVQYATTSTTHLVFK